MKKSMQKLSIRDVDLTGKRVLIRVDFNVPFDAHQNISDDNRIREALPTIQYALERDAKIILMSHLGRPKGQVDDKLSLKPVAIHLGKLLGIPAGFAIDCVGQEVETQARRLQNGGVLLLENLRFHPEETANDPEFAQKLAKIADIYVNDAFGSAHRAHASTEGVTHYVDTCVSGFLMEKELKFLGTATADPEKPFAAILGGAKVADKIPVIENLIKKADRLIIGGGMMFTFLKAQGLEIGSSLLDEESLDFTARILKKFADKIVLPVDCLVSDRFDFKSRQIGSIKEVPVDSIPKGYWGLDIGSRTIEIFRKACLEAKTIVWNGPMGVFEMEETARGTIDMAKAVSEATERGAMTIVGGGDSAMAIKKAGVTDKISHVSTGGGASLEFLQGKTLPGVEALNDA